MIRSVKVVCMGRLFTVRVFAVCRSARKKKLRVEGGSPEKATPAEEAEVKTEDGKEASKPETKPTGGGDQAASTAPEPMSTA